jgi:hypothetical protein
MKKIRWDPEQLSVESIATERDGGAARGTVRGHDSLRSWYECTSQSGFERCICPLGDTHNGSGGAG